MLQAANSQKHSLVKNKFLSHQMKLKKYILSGMILCLFSYSVEAQIFAQGKNINKTNAYFVEVELVPKPMDASKYHAAINFHGRRGDVDP